MNWFSRVIAVFLLAVSSLSAADRPQHHHRGLVRIVAHAVRWVLICFCLALPIFGNCSPPYDQYSGMCCDACDLPFGGWDHDECSTVYNCPPNTVAYVEVWVCDNVFPVRSVPPAVECLINTGCRCQDPSAAQVIKKAPWVFEPVTALMHLWPRFQAQWEAAGRRGACERVKATRITGPVQLSLIPGKEVTKRAVSSLATPLVHRTRI